MAKVLHISQETERQGLQDIGDIVGVFEDSHKFSDYELGVFGVATISGSAADVRKKLEETRPRVEMAYLWDSDGKYHWTRETKKDPAIMVYRGSATRWYRLRTKHKFPLSVSLLSDEEAKVLQVKDVGSQEAGVVLPSLVKNVGLLPGNYVEVGDLMGTEP